MTAPGDPLLAIEDLRVSFELLDGRAQVLDGISLAIEPGEVLGLVGESGSGKSVTALAIMALLAQQGRIDSGRISFLGQDLVGLGAEDMCMLRGREISMIFQEPMTSLNPVYTVGSQIAEVLTAHLGLGHRAAQRRAAELMRQVGIPAADRRLNDYPHQMSGGMRQRVMIAMAIACRPKLLIADEPTTALDVTIQAQILELLLALKAETSMGLVLITHDMGVVAETASRVIVQYAGRQVETNPTAALF